jgi:hypothetical protein
MVTSQDKPDPINNKIVDASRVGFSTLIAHYNTMQQLLTSQVKELSRSGISSATPGMFILLQFQMSQVTQIGDSISNLIAQLNSLINRAVSNQRAQ